MSNLTKPILIIGGMGPQASIKLHEIIVSKSRKFHNGAPDQYPSIIHLSLQISDFISDKTKEKQAAEVINSATKHINLETISTVCIACNTAHGLIGDLRVTEGSFVSMIDATIDQIKNSGFKSVGLLASPNTIKSGLFEKPLLAQGIRVLKPNVMELKKLERIIRSVIDGSNGLRERLLLSEIAEAMQRRGAKAVLLGCTELPIVGIDGNIPSFDSIDALAEKVIEKHFSNLSLQVSDDTMGSEI